MKKITTRFAFLMAAAAVLPLLAYGAVSILSLRAGTKQTVIQGNLNVARRSAEQINLYVTSGVKILRAVAADLQHTGLAPWQQDRILKNYVLQFPEFTELTLLDDSGAPVVSSRIGPPTVSVPGSDSVNVEGALMSPFTVDDDLLPTAIVAIRLSGGGWLVGLLNLEELWRMVNRIRVGDHGVALLVSGPGQLLAHGDPAERSRVARGENMLLHPLIMALQRSPNGPVSAEYQGTHGPVLGVAAPVTALQWTVVVEQPTSEAFAIASRLQLQLGVAIGAALLLMVVAGYKSGRSFIQPIFALMRGTRALAEGHLGERVPVDSTDELGQLGQAFNNMADRLVELQEDVRKKERESMFGRVAVGLVHDLSHPIQNIGNSCKLIVKMFDDVDYRESFRKTVERELSEVKRMMDDLRNIAKPLPLEKFPIDVNRALGELVESMQTTAERAGLTIDRRLVFGPLYIEGDLFALNRVYRNLIVNAFQATAPGGEVIVRTMRQNDVAVIEVADTGCGIPTDRLETIFEDFATTKRRGLGLGLAISKKIVEQLGGTITVSSEVGRGSTFTLHFPMTKARPSQRAAG
ncbi:MAG TPA: sensor histidine kinase [Vicinamibacterales bacterium]|nr:sensor histidine kinase [Vicinamibacterales bacterium]